MQLSDNHFMSDLKAAEKLRPPRTIYILFSVIIAFILACIIWGNIATVEKLVRGSAQVVPSQEVKYVQSLEGGVLQDIFVQQGQHVKKGEPLLKISDVQFSSQEKGTQAEIYALTAKKERLKAEAEDRPLELPAEITENAPQIAANEMALYNSRQQEYKNALRILDDRITRARADQSRIQSEINRLSQSKSSLNEELEITKRMVAQRAMPKLEQLRLEREIKDVEGQINSEYQRKRSLQAEVQVAQTERTAQKDSFRSDALSEMNAVETQMSSLSQNLVSIGDRKERSEIRSPVDGVVNNISINTIGGVVEPAAKLMEIVPMDDSLKIIGKVAPDDIGFIRVGHPAKVKITAFDPTIFGSLSGKVTRIGANTMTDQSGNVYFEIEIMTDKNYLGEQEGMYAISPGMTANVDVVTGKQTIMRYILKPIFRAWDRALTEI